jgi:hypothetical protein
VAAIGRSLYPTNPFFENLARKEKEAAIPCISLVSEADTMVLPQKNLVPVTKGWTMRITPYATHAGIMTKASVCRMIAWECTAWWPMRLGPPPHRNPRPKKKTMKTPVEAPVKTPVEIPEAAPVENAAEKRRKK